MKYATVAYLSTILIYIVILVILIATSSTPQFPEQRAYIEDDVFYIDLNKATAEDLQQIPGVGPVLAENIVMYREENGAFTEYGQLLNVKGIGNKTLEVIMEYVRII